MREVRAEEKELNEEAQNETELRTTMARRPRHRPLRGEWECGLGLNRGETCADWSGMGE